MKENFMEVIYDDEKMLFDLKGPSSDDTLFTKNANPLSEVSKSDKYARSLQTTAKTKSSQKLI